MPWRCSTAPWPARSGDFHDAGDGEVAFSALLAEELLVPGRNLVSLLLPTVPGGRTFTLVALS